MPYEIVPLAHPIPQACKRVGVGETKLREAIKAGELEIIKIGDRTLLEDAELMRWIATKRVRMT